MWADGPHDIKNAHHNLIRMLFFLSFCFLLIKKDKNLHSFKYGCPRVSPGRVCAQPGTDPPESGDKKMHPPPTAGVVGSDGSDHQRVAVGSVGVENPENGENRRENGENKPEKQRKSGQNL